MDYFLRMKWSLNISGGAAGDRRQRRRSPISAYLAESRFGLISDRFPIDVAVHPRTIVRSRDGPPLRRDTRFATVRKDAGVSTRHRRETFERRIKEV
jgi:hypothetical protein